MLAHALPLAELIWVRETENKNFATPERRAGLERRLGEIAREIRDEALRRHYQADFKERFFQFFRRGSLCANSRERPSHAARRTQNRGQSLRAQNAILRRRRRSVRASRHRPFSALGSLRLPPSDGLILLLLLNHPGLIGQHIEDLSEIAFSSDRSGSVARCARCLISVFGVLQLRLTRQARTRQAFAPPSKRQGFGPMLQKLDAMAAHASHWYVKAGGAEADAEEVLKQALTCTASKRSKKNLQLAELAFGKESSEGNFSRLKNIQEQLFTLGGTEASLEGFGVLSGRPSGTL